MAGRLLVAALSVAWLLEGRALVAHHAFSAEFDANKPVTLRGAVTRVDWINPHSWLYIDVKNQRGQVENWAVEFSSPNSLYRRGWRKSDLPPKDVISVVGYPSRDTKSRTISATDVKLPDGRTLFAGAPIGN